MSMNDADDRDRSDRTEVEPAGPPPPELVRFLHLLEMIGYDIDELVVDIPEKLVTKWPWARGE